MMRRSLLAILILSAGSSTEASNLKGRVVLNELGGPPVANVTVGAVAGAIPTATDSLGLFTIEFPGKRPGETVQLIIQKEGFEVVNDIQLETAVPIDPDAKPVAVLICMLGNREEMARRYYRLKSAEAIEENYRKRVLELEKAQKASSHEMVELREQRDQALSAAEKTAEELAKTKLDQASELYRTAMRSFLEGKTDQALKALDEEKLRDLVTSARGRKEEAEKEIEEATQAWLLKAQLFTTQFQFEEAEKAFWTAIEASPESFAANFAYARFSQDLNRYQQAQKTYERCLELARRSEKDADTALTLNNLGNLDAKRNRMDLARKEYDEALKIRRALAQKNPETYLPAVANTLNNLGNIDTRGYRMEDARMEFEEALKIYRELPQKNPETYLPALAGTLNNLGNLDSEQKRMEEARKEYEEALKIRRELAQKNPETYLPLVAGTLHNLGSLDSEQNRLDEASKEYEEALKILRQLAQKNPEANLPDVAGTLNNLGSLDYNRERMREARNEYEEALKIRRELAEKSPETYLPDVAITLYNLGILDSQENRMDEARKDYEEGLKIFREFAQRNPDTQLPYVAMTLNNLGNLDVHENRGKEARKEYEEALKIRRELAQKNLDTYLPGVADILNNLGNLDTHENRIKKARKEYEEALKIYQRFVVRDPAQFQPLIDKVLRNLGELPN